MATNKELYEAFIYNLNCYDSKIIKTILLTQWKNIFMSRMKELDEIAQGVADVTMEIMYDSVEWQLSDFEQDGDDFNAIHSHVMYLAIAKMYEQTKKKA